MGRRLAVEAFSDSEGETIRFGERLGAALRSRAVVALTGPLGAGKTRMVQGIARGAGYRGRVRSPTFALMNLYRAPLPLRHFDFYRLDSIDEGTAGEWEELLDDEGLSVIEWADRLPGIIPPGAIDLDIRPIGEGRRRILLTLAMPSDAIGDWKLR